MNSYSVFQTPGFEKTLRKLDAPAKQRILSALLALTLLEDPTVKLKPLRHSKAGLWRLRVGDYRVVVDVQRESLVIIALHVGHRSTVYTVSL